MVRYEDPVPDLLPKSVQGTRLQGMMPNGDFLVFLDGALNVPIRGEAQRMFPGRSNPMSPVTLKEWED